MKKHRLAIVLVEPEIPPNTGNIIRLCANTGGELHLVRPLGFPLEDSKLRRAGLDYHEYSTLVVHNDWQSCRDYFTNRRMIAVETSGQKYYHDIKYNYDDVLVFGSETRGLSALILNDIELNNIVRLPMKDGQRSLNLSNSVAITVYEVWRQLNFIEGV